MATRISGANGLKNAINGIFEAHKAVLLLLWRYEQPGGVDVEQIEKEIELQGSNLEHIGRQLQKWSG